VFLPTGRIVMPARILVVEDNADQRDLLAVLLRAEGYTVDTADDGEKGVELVKSDRPDLILSDISMPNLSGIEMVRVLRGIPECRVVPILILSSHGTGPLSDAIEAGADQVMRKPVEQNLLIAAIKVLLD
jgi:CheY-like chemotaxis protein